MEIFLWWFKFQYVFINSRQKIIPILIVLFFKFHYVSINSLLQQLAQQLWLSLNSIMFLLIHFTDETYFDEHPYFKFHYVSINSINPIASHIMLLFFKFHYVSINSPVTLVNWILLNNFKFHYVSINSLSRNDLTLLN